MGLLFDGVDDALTIAEDPSISSLPIMGIAFLLKPTTTNFHALCTKGTPDGPIGFELLHNVNNPGRLYYSEIWSGNNGAWQLAASYLPSGDTHHVIVMHDRSDPSNVPVFYIDGTEATPEVLDTPTGTYDGDAHADFKLRIGRRNFSGGGAFFTGEMDQFRMFNTLLTATQAKLLAAGYRGHMPGEVVWLRFDRADGVGDSWGTGQVLAPANLVPDETQHQNDATPEGGPTAEQASSYVYPLALTREDTFLDAFRVEVMTTGELYGDPYYGVPYYGTSVWEDFTDDVTTQEPIGIRYGTFGQGPVARVASVGAMELLLDNSDQNTAGLEGYYSPDHPNARADFELEKKLRFVMATGGEFYGDPFYGDPFYGGEYTKFVGRIKDIQPEADTLGGRKTSVRVEDWFAEAMQNKLERLVVRRDWLSGDAIQDIVAGIPRRQPESLTLADGQETFAFVFDSDKDEKTTAMGAAQKVVLSEFGQLYEKGNDHGGGELVFEDRHTRLKLLESSAILVDQNEIGFSASRDPGLIFNVVRATSYPRVVSDTVEVLFTLQTSIPIAPNQTVVITGRYSDPSNPDQRISGVDMVEPAATTDYRFSADEGDLGDLNGSFTISAEYGSNSVQYTLTNGSALSGLVTHLQARGFAVRIYEPVIYQTDDDDSVNEFSERALDLDLVYQDNPLAAKDYGDIVLQDYGLPKTRGKTVTFLGNMGPGYMAMGLRVEPGDRITIAESMTSVIGDYFVTGVEISIELGTLITFTWWIVPASIVVVDGVVFPGYWLAGVVGRSEAGVTTVVGF